MPVVRVRAKRLQTAVLRFDEDLQRQIPYREMVRLLPFFLTPTALIAGIMAAWRYGADAGWTDEFAVSGGLLSHWQVWLGIAVGIQWAAVRLNSAKGAPRSTGRIRN
jgi:hypothetical protein